MTEQTHLNRHPGPTAVRVRTTSADIRVTVGEVEAAEVRVSTADQDGPSAEAVRKTTFAESGGRLEVHVPEGDGGSFSSVSIGRSNYGPTVIHTAGRRINVGGIVGAVISGDGVFISGDSGVTMISGGSAPILVEVRLPAGSSLETRTISGDLDVTGELERAELDSTSGAIQLDLVRKLRAHSVSGAVDVRRLAGPARVSTVSGDIELHAVQSTRVTAESVSGGIRTTGARVELDAHSVSGRVRQGSGESDTSAPRARRTLWGWEI
jgi:putative adhesin